MDQNQYQYDTALAKRNAAASAPVEDTQEIDLLMLFNALRRHILVIIAVALVFALVAGIVVQFFITPLYEATTSTYLVSTSGGTGLAQQLLSAADLSLSNSIIGDYSDIIKSRTVLEAVINKMNADYDAQVAAGVPTTMKERLDYEYEEFYSKIEVTNPTDTHIIKITVTDADPLLARDIANTLTYYVVDRLADIMGISVPNVYDQAVAPDSPSYPSLTKTVVIAFVLGAVIAAGVIIFIAVMDTTVKTAEDIENRCGMVTLTKVYYEGGKKKKGYGYGGYGSYGYGYGYGYGYYGRGDGKHHSGSDKKSKSEKESESDGGAKK